MVRQVVLHRLLHEVVQGLARKLDSSLVSLHASRKRHVIVVIVSIMDGSREKGANQRRPRVALGDPKED